MADHRLSLKIGRIIEGNASGPLAIIVLAVVVIVALLVLRT